MDRNRESRGDKERPKERSCRTSSSHSTPSSRPMGARTSATYAAREYSPIRPPSRSRRTTHADDGDRSPCWARRWRAWPRSGASDGDVVIDVLGEHRLQVATPEDQHRVEQPRPAAPTQRSAQPLACGARTGVLSTSMPASVKTASNAAVNFVSRSRMRSRRRRTPFWHPQGGAQPARRIVSSGSR
jgi:hypothetical protein